MARPARPSASSPASRRDSRLTTRQSIQAFRSTSLQDLFWDLLTFDRLMTGPVAHLIYWAGLAMIVLGGFATIGGAVGMATHEDGLRAVLVVIPMLVVGLIFLLAGALIWRSVCEFYVAIFRIADDLRALRLKMEDGTFVPTAATPAPAPRRRPEPEPAVEREAG